MNKKILLLSIIAIAVGCTSKPIERPKLPVVKYSHPDHGIVTLPYREHKADRNQCKTNVFEKGAVIDGQLVTDSETLKKYMKDALFFSIRESEINLRRAVEDAGGAPFLQKKLNHDPTKSDKYYAEATRMENETNDCMAKRGWEQVVE